MSVKIRLTRRGAKKRPFYWVVAASSSAPRDGRFLEKLGTYNPMLAKDADKRIVLVEERVRHWLSVGAQPSERVARMLHEKGILETAPVRRPQTKKPLPKAKAQERLKEAEEAAAAAASASAEAPAVGETPATEAEATTETPAETPAPAEAEATTEMPEEAPAENTPEKGEAPPPAEKEKE